MSSQSSLSAALPPWSTDPADDTSPPPALGDLFAAPARAWPDRAAIDDGEVGYTFAQLERGAETVAAHLHENGVGVGDRVVVLAERRAVMPILAVAIWKCGAVYAPLDATEPAGRREELLARLRPVAVIALDDREPDVPGVHWLGGERLAGILSGPGARHTTQPERPEQAAYVIFASGPSGEPQGVEIGVDALRACFRGHNEVLRFTPHSRVLSLAPFHVDVSLQDTLLPLSVGAFVHQFRGLPAGAVMRAVLGREQITHLVAVSMLLAMVTGDGRQVTRAKLPALELVMTGAQVCDPAVLAFWVQLPGCRVVHAFGPPEATIFSLFHEIGDAGRTAHPVGRPVRGVTARIVADGVEVRQPGAQGELWVGGAQVMRGYVGAPEETARVVVEQEGTRWFRTGDVCSLDEDGDVVFHRHADAEIRWLAGRRTHLGEIRRAALGCPGVEGAAVAVVERRQREVIALVVVSAARGATAEVEARLRDALPQYMRPGLLARSAVPVDEGQALRRLTAAAQESTSNHFVLAADGAAEPSDEAESCL